MKIRGQGQDAMGEGGNDREENGGGRGMLRQSEALIKNCQHFQIQTRSVSSSLLRHRHRRHRQRHCHRRHHHLAILVYIGVILTGVIVVMFVVVVVVIVIIVIFVSLLSPPILTHGVFLNSIDHIFNMSVDLIAEEREREKKRKKERKEGRKEGKKERKERRG